MKTSPPIKARPMVIIIPPINERKLNCGHLWEGLGASVLDVVVVDTVVVAAEVVGALVVGFVEVSGEVGLHK